MNWNNFLTYNDSPENAFEILCNQLFERYLRRNHKNGLTKFRIINGAGGDGGIEAYGELACGDIIAIQSKWFRQSLGTNEIKQIKKSITTAKDLRPQIRQYIICIPHDVWSLKYGRGKKGESKKRIEKFEEKTIDDFTSEIKSLYSDLNLTWWFEKDIDLELQNSENEGIHKYWFDKEVISLDFLKQQFTLQRSGWLAERYIPELHGQGLINEEYNKLCFSEKIRESLYEQVSDASAKIQFCLKHIDEFIPTNKNNFFLNQRLCVIKKNLNLFLVEFKLLANAISTGNENHQAKTINEILVWRTKLILEKIPPNNLQKNTLPKLISSLDKVHKYHLPQIANYLKQSLSQSIRLVIGDPGTGKTHGLANIIEQQLGKSAPAIIIQAKESPHNNWTEILSQTLELNGWNKNEIFTALEALANKNDLKKCANLGPGIEPNYESTKAIICIDGLDEAIENKDSWYERIRETEHLTILYPRIKFIFSARESFYDRDKIRESGASETLSLPREGDIPIMKVAPKYFSKDHYNIKLASIELIRPIDSLFALRLFCDHYRDQTLEKTDQIVTATRKLLQLRIETANHEFVSNSLSGSNIGETKNPILDSLEVVSNHFYKNSEIEHDELIGQIASTVESYLNKTEIDSLVDFLVKHGFLIRSEKVEEGNFLDKKKYVYFITYQSIIEHIISEKIYRDINNGSLTKIPDFLHQIRTEPFGIRSEKLFDPFEKAPNQKIISNIAKNVFYEKGKLIGENGFLSEGFESDEILELQMEALVNAPKKLASGFKAKIDNLFLHGGEKQYIIFKNLILPSSESNERYFGAEYLHNILISQASVFEQDKLWSGLDRYEKGKLGIVARKGVENPNIQDAFDEFGLRQLYITDSALHNEKPLVYAWGLSTIDQSLRDKLRIVLTKWAIKSPSEFRLLLGKIFVCDDPQIHEDLASIMLGIASKLKDKTRVNELALWALKNVFDNSDKHRNIIVRQGFRSIVERAYQYGEISKDQVIKSRPMERKSKPLLSLDAEVLRGGKKGTRGEVYPIVHDLAWYVIEDSFRGFLEYPHSFGTGLQDKDCPEAKNLLDKYRKKYGHNNLFAYDWAMAAAISYIRKMGFTRKKGNWHTDETHGSKSKIFTYEEKYTWLAVHYLQGYLSDNIPMKQWSEGREFVKDYSQLTNIPNPAESFLDKSTDRPKRKKEWIVKQTLSRELEAGSDLKFRIKNWVNEDPNLNFKSWLKFSSADLNLTKEKREWIALLNKTSLHDSKKIVYTLVDARACIIKKDDLHGLKKIIEENPDALHFISDLEYLRSSPQTETYCNPSDIVWMTWIDEDEKTQRFYDEATEEEKEIDHAITRIIQNTMDGESILMLPSKKVRELIQVYELNESELRNQDGTVMAFNHKISDGSFDDDQELVLVDYQKLKQALDKENSELIWFIDLYKKKNPLNKSLGDKFYIQKSRKYFVWIEDGEFKSIKFWDEAATNIRDKDFG